jgi:hypothetical protein
MFEIEKIRSKKAELEEKQKLEDERKRLKTERNKKKLKEQLQRRKIELGVPSRKPDLANYNQEEENKLIIFDEGTLTTPAESR